MLSLHYQQLEHIYIRCINVKLIAVYKRYMQKSCTSLGINVQPEHLTQRCLALLNDQHITLDAALNSVDDMLLELSYPSKQFFFLGLQSQGLNIEALVSFHLGLSANEGCRMAEVTEWICGYYSVCIPIYVNGRRQLFGEAGRRVLFRVPLPYKMGEEHRPGNVGEKLRCEAATFLWIQEKCPEVPIPKLFGFGFPSESCVCCLIHGIAVSI